MKLNRRNMILSGAAMAAVVSGVSTAHAIDLSDLDTPPAMGERVLGNPDAPVTVIEYASMTCPHCARFHKDTWPKLKEEFVDTGKVRFVFREFPFDDLALAAFMLARCTPQEKYFPFIDVLFERQNDWVTRDNPRQKLFDIAKLAGFTEASFNACMTNEEVAKGIVDVQKKAQEDYGVNATPTFFINGEKLGGNAGIEQFREMIEAAQS